MLEKIGQFAEQAATNVSRRQFLGRLGRGATLIAVAAGGLLAFDSSGEAARRPPRVCSEFSCCGCAGQFEGSECSSERASGKCVGIRGKDSNVAVVDCDCDTKTRR